MLNETIYQIQRPNKGIFRQKLESICQQWIHNKGKNRWKRNYPGWKHKEKANGTKPKQTPTVKQHQDRNLCEIKMYNHK